MIGDKIGDKMRDGVKVIMLEAQVRSARKYKALDKCLIDLRESLENYISLGGDNDEKEFSGLLKTIYAKSYSKDVDFQAIRERTKKDYGC